MTNRIRELQVVHQLSDPAEPEVWVGVVPEHENPAADVRGRLMGPRCAFASTVEVAYPLRPFPKPPEGLRGIARRVVIPEASLWEPESPFLYQGPVELWERGQCCDQVPLSRGLCTVSLTPRGLRVNGRPFTVRGVVREQCSEEEARQLRRGGINTLLTPVNPGTMDLWGMADRLGFFVLGRVIDAGALQTAPRLRDHPSCLGWLFDPGLLRQRDVETFAGGPLKGKTGPFIGTSPGGSVPASTGDLAGRGHFAVATADLLPDLRAISFPALVLTPEDVSTDKAAQLLSEPGVLGLVRP